MVARGPCAPPGVVPIRRVVSFTEDVQRVVSECSGSDRDPTLVSEVNNCRIKPAVSILVT
ncbi:Uncharacterised protein [Bordetella pertussis]|uniref:Uncharacterized protein n=1 Tax=Bordetella pertussis TaxID=520 RepID=Q84CQ6_BORPT|nr:hypothetical protein [Bordetella pertussis Tohama I]CFP64661.1 Uncharacterised protein [Bordetella pertussis]